MSYPSPPEAGRDAPAGQDVGRRFEGLILDKYAPAHVVVSGDGEVLYYSRRTGKYLEPPAGSPSRNLLDLARSGLRPSLRSALHEAMETQRPTKRANIDIDGEGGRQTIDLSVEPLPATGDQRTWLIVFTDVGGIGGGDKREPIERPSEHEDDIIRVEEELRQTRETLRTSTEEYQVMVEELKSANEEMLSVNEELQSSNEELESAKEELQSVNEELQIVNTELSHKVDELDRSHSDLKNLFDNTKIAMLFLDGDLTIRSF